MEVIKKIAGIILSLGMLSPVCATTISFTTEFIAGSDWRFHYTVANDSLSTNVAEFTIYFDRNLYTNLAVDTSPGNWDSIVVQSDLAIPSDGFFDTLALADGLISGSSLSGFAVTFTFLGSGAPGFQPFEIIDSNFTVTESGITTAPVSNSIPEPKVIVLFLIALVALRLAQQCRQEGIVKAACADQPFSAGGENV